jgi:hypothetical protein
MLFTVPYMKDAKHAYRNNTTFQSFHLYAFAVCAVHILPKEYTVEMCRVCGVCA